MHFIMSNTSEPNGEINRLFHKHIPEIADGTVEIVSIARDAGRRTCLAVRSHDPKLSAVKVCLGKRGTLFRAIATELGGEHLTIITWHASPEQLIHNAFFDPLLRVSTDTATRRATITVDRKVSKFVMRGDDDRMDRVRQEIATLVSRMTGWKICLIVLANDRAA